MPSCLARRTVLKHGSPITKPNLNHNQSIVECKIIAKLQHESLRTTKTKLNNVLSGPKQNSNHLQIYGFNPILDFSETLNRHFLKEILKT
jgi:hypothetical protein